MGQPGFEGHVDFYGYHAEAGGYFVGGWLSHPWAAGEAPHEAVAEFADTILEDHRSSAFYHREDVAGRGIGFLVFLQAPSPPEGELRSLRIITGGGPQTIQPTPGARFLHGQDLTAHLLGLLEAGGDQEELQAMRTLVTGGQPAPVGSGIVDLYGFSALAGGWFFAGWLRQSWPAGSRPNQAAATLSGGTLAGDCLSVRHARHDVPYPAEGFVAFLQGGTAGLGTLAALSITAGDWQATLTPASGTRALHEAAVAHQFEPLLAQVAGADRDALARLLGRQPYRGHDTLGSLQTPILLAIDEAIVAGQGGLILMGWLLAHPGALRTIRVHCGEMVTALDLASAIRTDRPDVLQGHAGQGFTDPACGFIATLPGAVEGGERTWLEVETAVGEIGYLTVPRPKLAGIAAIKRLLAAADLRFGEVGPAFDAVIGPAVAALNQARLAVRPLFEVIAYGAGPATPRWSIIIPLYGRLDYVEYQLALFSAHPAAAATEFIFVLDEPARRREAQFLFASVLERYDLPFKAVLLETNVGFAPASNAGLSQATGAFVVFMNSDVFPGPPDWLERLTTRLDADPAIGVIGPMLLFEDGAVQHQGMVFERLPEFGGLFFGIHPGKGMRPAQHGGLAAPLAITGACMMLARSLAEQLGGFDERYIIGDFEDSDLCLRLHTLGYRCAVDTEVALVHLERKSQAGSGVGWRMGLTVYNAWQHHRRWAQIITARQG